jgi:hypothetical protein
MGCCYSKKKLSILENYACGISEDHLRSSIMYYEWACEKWTEAALRESCIRALEEAKYIRKINRVNFLKEIPVEVLKNKDFQSALKNQWVETVLEDSLLVSYCDEESIEKALESI